MANTKAAHPNEINASVLKSWADLVDDLTELRAQFIALLAKLDDDGGVTDVNYEETLTPAALLTVK